MSTTDESDGEETEFIWGDRFDLGLDSDADEDDRWDEITERIEEFADQSDMHDHLGAELLSVIMKAENFHARNSGVFLPTEARNAIAYALFAPVERTLETGGEAGGSPVNSLPADELEELKADSDESSETSTPGYY